MQILVGMETAYHKIQFFSQRVRHFPSIHIQCEINSFFLQFNVLLTTFMRHYYSVNMTIDHINIQSDFKDHKYFYLIYLLLIQKHISVHSI